MKVKIAFRVDAGHKIGFGHLKRCLVLACELKKKMDVIFIIKDEKEAIDLLKKENFKIIKLNKKINQKEEINVIKKIIIKQKINKILIALKEKARQEYIDELKKIGVKTILLDNPGEGRKNADIVIYPLAHADKNLFKGIKGKLYYGWDYSIVDKKFFGKRKAGKGKPKILVTMGGSDIHNLTPKIISALKNINQDFECFVVIGPGFRKTEPKMNDKRFVFKKNVKNTARLMLSSSLGIILFGVSAYEAVAARLPCILLSSPNDKNGARMFEEFGTSIFLGDSKQFSKNKLKAQVANLLKKKTLREKMQKNCQKFLKKINLDNYMKILKGFDPNELIV